jgi:hypothetical protein
MEPMFNDDWKHLKLALNQLMSAKGERQEEWGTNRMLPSPGERGRGEMEKNGRGWKREGGGEVGGGGGGGLRARAQNGHLKQTITVETERLLLVLGRM